MGSPPSASQYSEAAFQNRNTPVRKVKGEDTFYAIADRKVSKERLASRTLPTQPGSFARPNSAVRKQIASTSASVESDGVQLFGKASSATESSSYTEVMLMIQPPINEAI